MPKGNPNPTCKFQPGNKVAKGGARPGTFKKDKEKKRELMEALAACDANAARCWARGLDPDNDDVPWPQKVQLLRIHIEYRIGKPTQRLEVTGTATHVREQIQVAAAGSIAKMAAEALKGGNDHEPDDTDGNMGDES